MRELGVACTLQDDNIGLIVGVPEDLPDATEASLEARYEALHEEQAGLVDQSEGGLKKHLAGFRLELPDGQSCMVALQPDIANRLLDCFRDALNNPVCRAAADGSASNFQTAA